MSNFAFEITSTDVETVLRSNSLAVANTNGKSFASMAEEQFDDLDFFLIEDAALSGDDLNQQKTCAYDEIARQLREKGILEPLKVDPHADLKAKGYSVHPSEKRPDAFQWQLQMVHDGKKLPPIKRPEHFSSEALAWADAQKFQNESSAQKNPDTVTLRLTLDVTYNLKGESITVPRVLLRDIVKYAIANGLFTGNTEMEVEDHTAEVTQIDGLQGEEAPDRPTERNRG